jgi:hypothetical protein
VYLNKVEGDRVIIQLYVQTKAGLLFSLLRFEFPECKPICLPQTRIITQTCKVCDTTLHYTALHCTTLQYTTLHYTHTHTVYDCTCRHNNDQDRHTCLFPQTVIHWNEFILTWKFQYNRQYASFTSMQLISDYSVSTSPCSRPQGMAPLL